MEFDFSSRFRKWEIRVLKQQRRRRLRKRHLKSEFARAASNFIAPFPSRFIRQMLANFLELNSKANASKFRERKRKSLSCVHVLDKT